MPRLMSAIASVALAAAVLSVPMRASAEPTARETARANANSKRTLDRPLPELKFNGSSLGDVIDFLADVTGANFSVDWKALDAAKVEKDTPITLRMSSEVPLRKALKLILQQAAGGGVLTYYVDDGIIQITSQEAADKEMITRTYQIQDLLFQPTDYGDAPNLNLNQQNQQGGGGAGGGGGGNQQNSIFNNTTTQENSKGPASRTDRANEIIKLITDTVRPEIWQVNGGTATISFYRDSLIITAPRSVHEQISSQ